MCSREQGDNRKGVGVEIEILGDETKDRDLEITNVVVINPLRTKNSYRVR